MARVFFHQSSSIEKLFVNNSIQLEINPDSCTAVADFSIKLKYSLLIIKLSGLKGII